MKRRRQPQAHKRPPTICWEAAVPRKSRAASTLPSRGPRKTSQTVSLGLRSRHITATSLSSTRFCTRPGARTATTLSGVSSTRATSARVYCRGPFWPGEGGEANRNIYILCRMPRKLSPQMRRPCGHAMPTHGQRRCQVRNVCTEPKVRGVEKESTEDSLAFISRSASSRLVTEVQPVLVEPTTGFEIEDGLNGRMFDLPDDEQDVLVSLLPVLFFFFLQNI